MSTNLTRAFLGLFALSIVAFGCAGPGRPGQSPWSFEESGHGKDDSAAQPGGKQEQDEEAFKALAVKIDEYQELLAVCDSLAQTEENREMRDSCGRRLKALREELIELTKPGQEQQE